MFMLKPGLASFRLTTRLIVIPFVDLWIRTSVFGTAETVSSTFDCNNLDHADSLTVWQEDWHMKFNVCKWHFMSNDPPSATI